MKKRNLLLVILAVLLVFGLVVGCGPADETEDGTKPGTTPTAVTFQSATAANSGATSNFSVTLTLQFSATLGTLTANNVNVTGISGISAAAPTGGSGGAYNVVVSNIKQAGTLSVAVTKSGYTISGSPQTVSITLSNADVAKDAETYFGEYFAVYTTTNTGDTNEYVTIAKDASGNYSLTIEEKKNNVSIDKVVFSINKWETTPVLTGSTSWNAADDLRGSVFDKGYKLTGRIISVTNEYAKSRKTFPNSTGTAGLYTSGDSVPKDKDFSVCIYIGENAQYPDEGVYMLVRAGFNLSDATTPYIAAVTGTETTPKVRVYNLQD